MATLSNEYEIREITAEELRSQMTEWGPKIFSDNDTSMNSSLILSDLEKENLKKLNKNLSGVYALRLGVYKGDEFCGWFCGEQHSAESFYMRNTAIYPDHRRKGLYTSVLEEVMRRVKAEGFQIIYSRHNTTNNAIIIPKLKAGFKITTLEVSERFGTLVHLTYFFNDVRSQILDFRSGNSKPSKEVKQALGIE
ncbi:GNAT family N-acetyltransferase [Bdellovibrio sp. HCB-162]|uniref:GNAT family N-acetyltransferase n=1 Tax=Bdellovibrio sp. HCB-162 TaxID=3394234 RepID=UPI0039BD214F